MGFCADLIIKMSIQPNYKIRLNVLMLIEGGRVQDFCFLFNQLLIICNCVPGERRENSLEQASGKWLQKVRHERFADTVHASRLRVEQGWCKNKTEERRRFAATVYSKVLAEFLTFGSG